MLPHTLSRLVFTLMLMVGALSLPQANAATIYSTGDDGQSLITIDTDTGIGSTIGLHGIPQAWAYPTAFTPDGILWTAVGFEAGDDYLGRFNLQTGAISLVGLTGITNSGLAALDADASGTLYGGDWGSQFLYTLNKNTGQATVVGAMNMTAALMDLAFDNFGTLYAIADGSSGSELYTINPSTGAATYQCTVSGTPGYEMGLAVHPSTNIMYATLYDTPSYLYELNPATCVATQVGSGIGIDYPHGGDILPLQGTIATFEVTFNFADGNNIDSSTAYISCTGGLPLDSNQAVVDGSQITFILELPEAGADSTICDIWVDGVGGYTVNYNASGANSNGDDKLGCHYSNIDNQDTFFCEITMRPENSFLTVNKTWDVTGNSAEVNNGTVNLSATIKVCSNGDIIRRGVRTAENRWCVSGPVFGPQDDSFSVTFNGANFAGNNVFIWEQNFDSAVEVDISDCVSGATTDGNGRVGGVAYVVFNGSDDSCTVANTVFYEGIPTLNQYGLTIMALLMLGVGFVGFRRFV